MDGLDRRGPFKKGWIRFGRDSGKSRTRGIFKWSWRDESRSRIRRRRTRGRRSSGRERCRRCIQFRGRRRRRFGDILRVKRCS